MATKAQILAAAKAAGVKQAFDSTAAVSTLQAISRDVLGVRQNNDPAQAKRVISDALEDLSFLSRDVQMSNRSHPALNQLQRLAQALQLFTRTGKLVALENAPVFIAQSIRLLKG